MFFFTTPPTIEYVINKQMTTPIKGEELFKKQMNEIHDYVLLKGCSSPEFYNHKTNAVADIKWIGRGEVVAGSYLSRVINQTIQAADVDIYFHSKVDAEAFRILNNLASTMDDAKFCQMAHHRGIKLNLIWGIQYDNVRDLIGRFDIRACAIAYDPAASEITYVYGAIPDCQDKRITYQTDPRVVSIHRLLKYIGKGFTIDEYQRAILAELIKTDRHSQELELITGYAEKKR